MPVLLEAGALTVRRARRDVLSGVALTLESGRAVHLAGANGSGKTSLLRVLAGLAAPRAGTVRRHGTCAFVPERVRLAPALRCGEWLRAMRGLRGLTGTDWPAALEASGLEREVADAAAGTLSRGMLQRLALLEALHAGCPLLLLDEPFSGLDDAGRSWLAGQLAERVDAGAAAADRPLRCRRRASPLDGVVSLRDGTAATAPTTAPAASARVTLRARHPDGRRLECAVAEAESDDCCARCSATAGTARGGGPPVRARVRYLALTAARTRAALPPLVATLFAVIGTYAYRRNEPGASFAVTSLMACALAAWTTGAVLAGEPAPQHEMATAALGGRRARTGLDVLLVTAVATVLTAVFIAYPLALVALGIEDEFDPHVRPGRRRGGRARPPRLRRPRRRDRRALRAAARHAPGDGDRGRARRPARPRRRLGRPRTGRRPRRLRAGRGRRGERGRDGRRARRLPELPRARRRRRRGGESLGRRALDQHSGAVAGVRTTRARPVAPRVARGRRTSRRRWSSTGSPARAPVSERRIVVSTGIGTIVVMPSVCASTAIVSNTDFPTPIA